MALPLDPGVSGSSRAGLFALRIEWGRKRRWATLRGFACGDGEVTGGESCRIAECRFRRCRRFLRCLLFRNRTFEHRDATYRFDVLGLRTRLRHLTVD